MAAVDRIKDEQLSRKLVTEEPVTTISPGIFQGKGTDLITGSVKVCHTQAPLSLFSRRCPFSEPIEQRLL